MTELTGGVKYANVLGSSEAQRQALDGTVPYCVSASGVYSLRNTAGGVQHSETVISLIGAPSDVVNEFGSAASLVSLAKTCGVRLSDMWMYLRGYGTAVIQLAVCDPSSFPTGSSQLLYECMWHGAGPSVVNKVRIPDIASMYLNTVAGSNQNVCMKITVDTASGVDNFTYVDFHVVSSVDD